MALGNIHRCDIQCRHLTPRLIGDSYFSSKFHIFDALVVVVAFLIDVIFRDMAGSIVVALRLWRVFKLIEELSSASQELLEKCNELIEELQEENLRLKRRLNTDAEEEAGDEDL
jgi:voltage-gated hydrogen channel 1